MSRNNKIDELREELNQMINKNIDQKEILKLSQELDIYIVEEMKEYSKAFKEEVNLEIENT